jgi:hypothetical protein
MYRPESLSILRMLLLYSRGTKKKDPLQLFGDHCRIVFVGELGPTTQQRVDHSLSVTGIAKNGVGIETMRHRIMD